MLGFIINDPVTNQSYYFEFIEDTKLIDNHKYLYVNGMRTNYILPRHYHDYDKSYQDMMNPRSFFEHWESVLCVNYCEQLRYFDDLFYTLKKNLYPEFMF